MLSGKDCLNKPFSHIYIEDKVKNNATSLAILENFKNSTVINIKHYKDVFTPSGQSLLLSKHSPSLILASKEGRLMRGHLFVKILAMNISTILPL